MGDKPICFPKRLFDIIFAIFLPPLYVIIHESRKTPPFKNVSNIFINMIYTSIFYIPGLFHALYLMNNDFD